MFYAGRDPERGKPFADASNMVSQLISLLSKRLSRRSDASGSAADFARNSLRELIPLLFRCYSAVSSAVIPLLIPLLFALSFRRQRRNSSRKYLNQRMFSRRDFLEKRLGRIFFPSTAESGLPADPESVRAKPPRTRPSGPQHAQKHACAAGRHVAADLIQLYSGVALLPALRPGGEPHRLLRRPEQRLRLVDAFAVLVGRVGIVDDAGAGLDMHEAVPDHRR